MNARIAVERGMADDNRIARLEVDVQHLQADVTEIKTDVRSLRGTVESLRGEFLSFKAEVAKEFGSVRTSMERMKVWMLVTGLGTILSVWGAALTLSRFMKA